VSEILRFGGITHSPQEIGDQCRPESTAQVIELSLSCRFHDSPYLRPTNIDA
jgi:hypothetical protein